ncbi:uncharacterized protein LOC122848838 [Aphidius gifuensis]|uniref:uncharacterized protein LOC122848838 n=1 Tax=Aphidius gifuensis TaxID=684658 RepID=UPI001CDCD297|nr:uncharacterized protein LOC122848838 [Aphidius gifuensis]
MMATHETGVRLFKELYELNDNNTSNLQIEVCTSGPVPNAAAIELDMKVACDNANQKPHVVTWVLSSATYDRREKEAQKLGIKLNKRFIKASRLIANARISRERESILMKDDRLYDFFCTIDLYKLKISSIRAVADPL